MTITILKHSFFISFIILFFAVNRNADAATESYIRDTVSRIAVISAFDMELVKLKDSTHISEVRVVNGRSHYLGKLAGHNVVLLLSGVSMTNAAITAQALFDHFTVSSVVFSGIAGGVNPGLHIGDVTVPAQWGSYQEMTFARKTDKGWDPGRFPSGLSNFGMMFPKPQSVIVPGQKPDSVEKRFWFPVDTASLRLAHKIADSIALKRCTATGECLEHTPKVVVGGNGVSGPTFVDNTEFRSWTWTTFSADALDMETSAVAMVAYINRTSFVAFRSLSDLAGGGPGKNEGKIFGKLAAENSATVVLAYLKSLPLYLP
jgi:adenosylhomocysteine nucleosidase